MSRASELAQLDIARASSRPFSLGTRPVIRWIKGDGRDDEVTRSAIAQATRIFGDRVDYCMCSAGIPRPGRGQFSLGRINRWNGGH